MLAGFERQTFKGFEVVIADDGSRPEVVNEIQTFLSDYPFRIIHSWHEDIGWRKNIALNQAIKKSSGSYFVFCDGDCIPHRHFVREHYLNQEERVVLTARRVYLSDSFSKKLSEEFIKKGGLENVFRHFLNQSWQAENGVYIPRNLILFYLKKRDNKKSILGCNFSLSKEALLEVNGFDERYLKPTVGEDTDLDTRLRHANYTIRSVKHLAIQYHVYHKRSTREGEARNCEILYDTIDKRLIKTPFGLEFF